LSKPLSGLRVLLLEDEYLIAVDVEQLCQDNGARSVAIVRSLDELDSTAVDQPDFDVAIIDLILNGASTLDFAQQLQARGLPFVFATGYTELDEVGQRFPGVPIVSKPYSSGDLLEAVTAVVRGRLTPPRTIP
jgi:CheY-like chemotaxis protein